MAANVFLDANVILDFLLKRKNYEDARKVIVLVLEHRIKAFISPSILHIASYWLTKAYGSPRAKELLLLLLSDVKIIDANQQIVNLALLSSIDDIEDALQYHTALHHHMDFFISQDKKFAQQAIAPLPVYNLPEFLEMFV